MVVEPAGEHDVVRVVRVVQHELAQRTEMRFDRVRPCLTIADALWWATERTDAAAAWRAGRLSIVRSFARYLIALDPATEIPPVGLLPEPSHRVVPHVYTDDEVTRIVHEAGRLAPEHRADTYQTLIGLIAATGMRVGEIVRLDRADVDLVELLELRPLALIAHTNALGAWLSIHSSVASIVVVTVAASGSWVMRKTLN